MKKQILLGAALLFAAGSLFAQGCEDCEIDQLPTGPRGAAVNTSDVNQVGFYQTADVFQDGTGNYSMIDQNGSNGTVAFGGNTNFAMVSQHGTSNHSLIDQNGDFNRGYVTQMGTSNFASQIVGVGWAENNYASSMQNGVGNTSFQTQYYDNNNATISQNNWGWESFGSNYAEQNQNSGANHVIGSNAHIVQTGGGQQGLQNQDGSMNYAMLNQNGSNSISVEDQTSDAGGYSSNSSYVTQIGDLQLSCVTQDASDYGHNSSSVYQNLWNYNSLNEAFVNQTASGVGVNLSSINQYGYQNEACVTQNATSGVNNSIINQTNYINGNGNLAIVNQNSDVIGNFSLVNQHGSNTAMVRQNNGTSVPF